MFKRLMSALGWVRREDLDRANFERDMAIAQVGKLRLRLAAYSARGGLVDKNMALKRDLEECKKQLAGKEAQYADAVSRWAGLARLWQEEHGGGLMYVTSEERKDEENENVALEAAAVFAGCAAEGTETGADCDPAELAGQGNTGASAGEQGDGIPKG